eukprot:gene337-3704_t
MNSLAGRANTIVSFGLSTLAFVTFLCALTTQFESPQPTVSINIHDVFVRNQQQYYRWMKRFDRMYFTFDLNSDLSSLFNWNTKLLFVYLTAEYESEENRVNQVVVWDTIIKRAPDAGKLSLRDLKLKYPFYDYGNNLKGNNVTISLHWNVIPVAGLLPRHSSGHITLQLDDTYA